MSRVQTCLVAGLLILFAATGSNAGTEDRTGFFTNLHFNEEGGDLLGYELYIGLVRDGYTGVLYECQGGCFPMQIIVPKFDGDTITFQYADSEGEKLIFTGSVDGNGITGSSHLPGVGSLGEVRLLRKQTYWNH